MPAPRSPQRPGSPDAKFGVGSRCDRAAALAPCGGVAGDRRTVRIELDVEVDREPIAGRLTSGAERTRDFTGWVALAHEIEHARDTAKRTSADDRDGGSDG